MSDIRITDEALEAAYAADKVVQRLQQRLAEFNASEMQRIAGVNQRVSRTWEDIRFIRKERDALSKAILKLINTVRRLNRELRKDRNTEREITEEIGLAKVAVHQREMRRAKLNRDHPVELPT